MADTSPQSYTEEFTDPFSGFYLAGGLTGSKFEASSDVNMTLLNKTESRSLSDNNNNIGANIYLGYGANLNDFYLGGEGFFLQKISGPGKVFLEISGEVTEYTLGAGQTLKVDPGYIAAFEESVNYDVTRMKGVKNMLFSGEGLFLATVTGPGKVWLQSMPISNLARKIGLYIKK